MRVLLVCRQAQLSETLMEVLKQLTVEDINIVSSCSEGRRLLGEKGYDLVMINTPLNDEFGTDFALDITEDDTAAVVLLVKNDVAEQVEEQVEETPIFVISKPVGRRAIAQDLRFIIRSREKMLHLKKKTQKLEKKVDDMRLIYRAKLYLMGYMDMSEEQAHRYIQKKAMNTRMTPRQVAEMLIAHYER